MEPYTLGNVMTRTFIPSYLYVYHAKYTSPAIREKFNTPPKITDIQFFLYIYTNFARCEPVKWRYLRSVHKSVQPCHSLQLLASSLHAVLLQGRLHNGRHGFVQTGAEINSGVTTLSSNVEYLQQMNTHIHSHL